MIVGNGLIASAFRSHFEDDNQVVVFASGVSNSRENRQEAFARERQLLTNTLRQNDRHILYFSTCSVHDPELFDTPYVAHKREMEAIVQATNLYAIFRLPQVVGKTSNPNTLTNYLYAQIKSGASFQVWKHAKRNLIDVDDVASIVNHLVKTSLAERTTINIACPFSTSIPDLIAIFESIIDKKASYTTIDTGGEYFINADLSHQAAKNVGIEYNNSYLQNLIRKYYAA